MVLALFDFDGTITTHDSFREFLLFSFGRKLFLRKTIRVAPWIAGFVCGLMARERAKEKVCQSFFGGMKVNCFSELAQNFCENRLEQMVRPAAMSRLAWHQKLGHRVILVSASLTDYLRFWCSRHNIELISTRLEQSNGTLTGRFATPNCWGPEKVRRIRELLATEDYEMIYAYGDSRGDKEMLGIAHEKGFRIF